MSDDSNVPEYGSPRISRRDFVKLGAAAGAGLGAGLSALPAQGAEAPGAPNILLIISDQLHAEAISAAGCSDIETPAIDRLAERGVRFELSHTANPLCSPGRSGIFSGRACSETGVHHNGLPIRNDIPNIGQWLSERTDYETVYFGKWHLPRSYTNYVPGFNCLMTGIGGHGYLAGAGIARACQGYLRKRSGRRPFMMVASFLQPHDICEWLCLNAEKMEKLPYPELADELPPLPDNFEYDPQEPQAVADQRGKHGPQVNDWDRQQWRYYLWSYYRHVETVDAEIGRVLAAVEECGYADDTVVILTADHGEGTAHHQMVRKNYIYDEALKVPLIVSWPDNIAANRVDSEHLVTGMDIMPTVCDYAGIDTPPKMRGTSLRPLLEQRRWTDRSFIVSEVFHNRGRMVRTPKYKYIAYADDDIEQLFDMESDPGETVNIAGERRYAEALNDSRRLLAEWHDQLDVTPNIPHRDAWC